MGGDGGGRGEMMALVNGETTTTTTATPSPLAHHWHTPTRSIDKPSTYYRYYKPISYLPDTPVERGKAGFEGGNEESRVRASMLLDGDAAGAEGDFAARTVI